MLLIIIPELKRKISAAFMKYHMFIPILYHKDVTEEFPHMSTLVKVSSDGRTKPAPPWLLASSYHPQTAGFPYKRILILISALQKIGRFNPVNTF